MVQERRPARRGLLPALLIAAGAMGLLPATASAFRPKPRPDAAKVAALVGAMTLDEKVRMLHSSGDAACSSPTGCLGRGVHISGVPRLGIPALRLADGPAGVRLGRQATAMPAPVSLAATFDPRAASRFGGTVAREARALNQDAVQAPLVNLVRVPTGGRNFETLGEDPFLSARLAEAEVRGIQAQGAMAVVKHLAGNTFEKNRLTVNVQIDDRTLHETELLPFEAAVNAGAAGVMCAYNRLDGVYSCSSDALLNGILRRTWGFTGWVRSDRGATHQLSDLVNGLDIEVPGDRNFNLAALTNAVTNGTPAIPATPDFPAVPAIAPETWAAAINAAVTRILGQMDRFGLLDGSAPRRPDLAALRKSSFATAERLAAQGATLLVNRDRALPLTRTDFTKGVPAPAPRRRPGERPRRPRRPEPLRSGVVVMGPSAAAGLTGGGGSAHGVPYAGVRSPFAALRGRAGKGAILSWIPGYDLDGAAVPADVLAPPVPTGVAGLLRQNITADVPAPGTPPALQPGGAPDQVDPGVDYTGARALPAGTAWRWSGTIAPPTSGRYQLKVQVANQARASLIIDGVETPKPAIDLKGFPKDGVDGLRQSDRTRTPRGLQQRTITVTLAAGQPHTIDLRTVAGGAPMQVRLAWVTPEWPGQKIAEAVAAARRAKKAIVFAYDETSEGGDRRRLTLPGYQDKLITAVARANPRTIVVLNTGGSVKMPWVRRVAAVLEMWYPGQRGGQATAKVLVGGAEPGGRLPETFPTSLRRQPSFSSDRSRYPGVVVPGTTFPTTVNSEGILVGYRWFDALRVRPLFEFGHGLSYTTFAYSNLLVRPRGDGHDVSFIVSNTGARTGADVPQVYLGPAAGSPVPMPPRALAGFRRVVLRPGQARRLRVHIGARELSYWSTEQQRWVVATGRRRVWVGPSSRELPLRGQTTATTAR